MQLVEQHGGTTTVLTVGPPEAEEQLRYAVSVGVGDGRAACATDGSDWDPQRTARAIIDAVASLEARRPVRPRPVRQRVGRLRRLPGRHPRRHGPRPADRQRRQGARRSSTAAVRVERETDIGPDRVRAAAAGRRRRQGGNQPAALPDDEGPAGLEEGGRRDRRADRRAGGQRLVSLQHAGRAGEPRRSILGEGPAPRRPWSTCWSSIGRAAVSRRVRRARRARPRRRSSRRRWRR